ncbi:MAG: hypothetical protein LUH04_08180 [Clostridium sp.]|nr:hypothetical protein [Clostridium sp.]
MYFTREEKDMAVKIMKHMNANHLHEDGSDEDEWTFNDVIGVALRYGLEHMISSHDIT